jgi:hypothetical protein
MDSNKRKIEFEIIDKEKKVAAYLIGNILWGPILKNY